MQQNDVVVSDPPIPQNELAAFEIATRDLVGIALRSLQHLEGIVSLPQFRLMLVLREHGRCSSTRLAQTLNLAGSSVTRMVDRLSAGGHVERGSDPSNRSMVTVDLTESGRILVDHAITHRRQELARLLGKLDPATREACAAGLAQLHHHLDDDYSIGAHSQVPL